MTHSARRSARQRAARSRGRRRSAGPEAGGAPRPLRAAPTPSKEASPRAGARRPETPGVAIRPSVSMTLARAWARAGEANSSPPRPETTSTSQPRVGRCFANERQRAAGPPAWSIGRCETSSSRFTQESHHTGLRASDGMDEASVVVPVSGPQPARLRTDVFLTFGGKGITLLLTVATVSVVARALGPSGTGPLRRCLHVEPAARSTRRPWPDDGESVLHGPTAGRTTADRGQCGVVRRLSRPRPRCRGRPPQAGGAGHRGRARLDAAPRHARRHSRRSRCASSYRACSSGRGGWSPTTRSTLPRRR